MKELKLPKVGKGYIVKKDMDIAGREKSPIKKSVIYKVDFIESEDRIFLFDFSSSCFTNADFWEIFEELPSQEGKND